MSSSSIPDSISKDALLALQVNAEADFVPEDQKPLYDGLTQSEVEELAFKTLRDASKICKDPMLMKVIHLSIDYSWIAMHSELSEAAMADNETEAAVCLARDGGKAQALYQIAQSIGFENDFTMPDED
jgi:hypothetical protein